MNMTKKNFGIPQLFVFVSQEDDGSEGIIGVQTERGFAPLIFEDESMLNFLEPAARMIAKERKKKIVLVKFSHRENVKEMDGRVQTAN